MEKQKRIKIPIYDLVTGTLESPVKLKILKRVGIEEKYRYIHNPIDAGEVFNQVFNVKKLVEEHLFLMCLDTGGKILGLFIISRGEVDKSMLNNRGIFIRALVCNASRLILAHNHPSGRTIVSLADEASFSQMKKTSNIVGIEVLDSLILGDVTASILEYTQDNLHNR